MLESIGESAVRMTSRTDAHLAGEQKEISQQKIAKAVQERPVEGSQESAKPEADAEKKNGGYNVDDDGVFFEKYDKDGKVIFRVPPEQKPIDQHA
jgi:hypothetical protein